MGITQDAARLRLQRAARAGQIMRVGFGKYRAKPTKIPDVEKGDEGDGKTTAQTASQEASEPPEGQGAGSQAR